MRHGSGSEARDDAQVNTYLPHVTDRQRPPFRELGERGKVEQPARRVPEEAWCEIENQLVPGGRRLDR